MSDMTWKDVRDLDCESLRTLGETWKSYAGSVSEQAQRLRDDVVKGHLSIDNYESDTADMVRDQVVMTADRFEDDLSDYALVHLSTGMFGGRRAGGGTEGTRRTHPAHRGPAFRDLGRPAELYGRRL